jgi:hypothetical protein
MADMAIRRPVEESGSARSFKAFADAEFRFSRLMLIAFLSYWFLFVTQKLRNTYRAL